MRVVLTSGLTDCAIFSICSSFSSDGDLIAIILGLHRTSLRLPFSLYTSPALGSTSCSMGGAEIESSSEVVDCSMGKIGCDRSTVSGCCTAAIGELANLSSLKQRAK
eukprot:SAG11_NODE_3093_length_2700_cov_1.726644_1_plen_107_part_00